MKKRTLTCVMALVLVVTVAAFAVPALAEGGSGSMRHGMMGVKGCSGTMSMCSKKDGLEEKFYSKAKFFCTNADEIGLTDGQVKEIKAVKIATKKTLIKQQAEIDVLAVDIRSMLYDEAIDTAAIAMLIDKKYDIKKERAKTLVNAIAKIKKVPTKGQMDKAKAIWKESKEMKGGTMESSGMMHRGMMNR